MKRRTASTLMIGSGVFVGLLGCASGQMTSKPMVVKEAKLPQGFPPPGPVGEVVIKDYPAYRLAQVRSARTGAADGQAAMFRPLFNHINRNKIKMTAPVEMGYPEQADQADRMELDDDDMRAARTMAFLYGEPTWGTLGEDPDDRRVDVKDVGPMTVLSVGVRGTYSDANFAEALRKLREWSEANRHRLQVVGPPRYLCYNSPFMLWFLRYAEVQLPVKRLTPAPGPIESG